MLARKEAEELELLLADAEPLPEAVSEVPLAAGLLAADGELVILRNFWCASAKNTFDKFLGKKV